MTTPTKPALPEPVAWLHDVVATDGEPDHALSFAPDKAVRKPFEQLLAALSGEQP